MAHADEIFNATETVKANSTNFNLNSTNWPKIETFFDNIVNFPEKSAMYEGTWLVDDIEDRESSELLKLAFGE
jgi:hypothetical protein